MKLSEGTRSVILMQKDEEEQDIQRPVVGLGVGRVVAVAGGEGVGEDGTAHGVTVLPNQRRVSLGHIERHHA